MVVFPAPLGPTSATYLAGFHFEVEIVYLESVGRARVAERHVIEDDAALELLEIWARPVFRRSLRRDRGVRKPSAKRQGLLENVVDAHQALDGLIQHQQGEYEAGEIAGS